MSAIRITNFLGIAPKIASELLPDTAAQVAENVDLFSGNLISYTSPVVASNSIAGNVKTLYALKDPVTGDPVFLSWLNDVDIAVAASNDDGQQRFYYTGDDEPRVSNYALATSGSAPFPVAGGYYTLGLPLPTTIPSVSAADFTQKSTVSFFRNTGGVVTITSTAHGLRTGNTAAISGFSFLDGTYTQTASNTVTVTITAHGLTTGATVPINILSGDAPFGSYVVTVTDANTFTFISPFVDTTSGNCSLDLRSFNVPNAEVTVVDANTFTYFSPGFPIGSSGTPIAYTQGRIDLGGLTQNRTYVYTWFTPWREESIASEPTADLFIKEGQIVTVSNLPTTKPAGDNQVAGIRLYRTLSSAAGTDYFRLTTLYFPLTISQVSRASNVSRVTTTLPHNLDIGDYVKVSGSSVSSFNITGAAVTGIVNEFTFEYAQTDANVSATSATGSVFHDVSQIPGTTSAQYWGDASFNFVDNFDSRLLLSVLTTDLYDPPPKNLKGLISYQNNILVGFVANEVYFSEPNFPHAWPVEYKITLEHNVVGLAAISGALLVLTDSYPYLIQGTDPANKLSVQRIDQDHPCLNRKSIVVMYGAVVWSTFSGLAVYSPAAGSQLITKYNYNNTTWQADLDPTTVVASFYRDKYFANHSQGAFIFERDGGVGGTFVTTDVLATASWYDSIEDKLYLALDGSTEIVEWNNPNQVRLTYKWKSKTFKTENMINLGAARVIADYGDFDPNVSTAVWSTIATTWNNTNVIYSTPGNMQFRFYVDKQLIYDETRTNSGTFRLPTGYRSDTFEFEVEGNIQLREIHLAETPTQLKLA